MKFIKAREFDSVEEAVETAKAELALKDLKAGDLIDISQSEYCIYDDMEDTTAVIYHIDLTPMTAFPIYGLVGNDPDPYLFCLEEVRKLP